MFGNLVAALREGTLAPVEMTVVTRQHRRQVPSTAGSMMIGNGVLPRVSTLQCVSDVAGITGQCQPS